MSPLRPISRRKSSRRSHGSCAPEPLTADNARIALDAALGTPQELVTPTASHVRRAFALREHIRVADGLYVALADELDCPLVTTDRRLAGANTPCEVRVPPPGIVPPPRDG
jgi:predicted nucleic acid-binding protein